MEHHPKRFFSLSNQATKLFCYLLLSLFLVSFPVFAADLSITQTSVAPSTISPDEDEVNDEAVISSTVNISGFDNQTNLTLLVTTAIKDPYSRVIKELRSRLPVSNNSQVTVNQVWDGRNRNHKPVANGRYTYEVTARIKKIRSQPAAGEVIVINSLTIASKALATIISPDYGSYVNGQIPVEVSYRNGVKTLELYVDDQLYQTVSFNPPYKKGSYVFTLNTQNYADGEHTLQVFAYLTGEGIGTKKRFKYHYSPLISITVDNAGPLITDLTPLPESIINASSPQISAVLDDLTGDIDPTTIQMKVDANLVSWNYDVDSGLVTFTPAQPLAEGAHSVEVSVNDLTGNSTSASWQFSVDTVAPQITIGAVEDETFRNNDVAPVVEISDTNIETQTITLNNQPFSLGTTITEEGTYALYAYAKDKAGNEASKTIDFVIDKTPPAINVSGVEDNFYYKIDVVPVIDVSDTNLLSQNTALNNQPFTSGTVINAEGPYNLLINASDKAGNNSDKTVNFTIDKTAPSLTVNSLTSPTNISTQTVSGTYIDDHLANIKVNGVEAAIDAGTKTYSAEISLIEGDNPIDVVALDEAGNFGSVQTSVTLDTIPPVVEITSPANGAVVNTAQLTVIYTVDGIEKTKQVDLIEGANIVEISEADSAGNTGSDTITVTLDTVAPVVEITSPLDGALVNTPQVTVEYTVDGIAKTKNITLTEGLNSVKIEEADEAGNIGSATITVTLDTIAPVVEITSPQDGFLTNNAELTVEYTVDGLVKTKNVTLVEGVNSIKIEETDEAGNASSATISVTLDTIAPALPQGLTAVTGDTVVDLAWTANTEGDLAGYNIYRATNQGGPYTKVNPGLNLSISFVDSGLDNNLTYYYVVTAVDNLGNESGYSAEISVVLADTIAPAAPQGLIAVAGDTQAKLTWNANSEADLAGYNIYRAQTTGGPYSKVNSSLVSCVMGLVSYQDTGLANGTTYYYVITAVDTSGNESGYSSEISVKPVAFITNVSDAPDAFSPNGNAAYETTTINYQLTKLLNVTVKIYDSNNNIVRSFKDNVAEPSGIYSVVWDGKNASGNVLDDGPYVYKITCLDAASGLTVTKVGTVTVDNHYAQITNPSNNSTLTGVTTFTVVTSQYNTGITSLAFSYRLKGTYDWILLGYAVQQGDGTWQINWNTESLADGIYEVAVTYGYKDLNGHNRAENTLFSNYSLSNPIKILNVSDSPDAFSPNGNGTYDANTINYVLTKAGRVTIKVYDSQNGLVKTLKDDVSENSGPHTAVWNGKNGTNQVVLDGVYTYKIDAIDSGGKSAPQVSGTVTVDNNYAKIIEPAAGTKVFGVTTLKAAASDYNTGITALAFSYRIKDSGDWVYFGNAIQQGDGTWQLDWNTDNLSAGAYEVVISYYYYDLNNNQRAENTLPIEYQVASDVGITNVFDSPDAFTPNGNGIDDTGNIHYTLMKRSFVTFKIYDSGGGPVRVLANSQEQLAGNIVMVWDGKDDGNQLVDDGTYTYTIDARDSAGNDAEQQTGTITVDKNFVVITSPPANSTVNGVITLTAAVSPYTNPVNLGFSYRKAGQEWTYFGNAVKQSGNIWQIDWDARFLDSGLYEIAVSYSYDDLNNARRFENSLFTAYNLDNPIEIIEVSDSPDAFSPNGNNAYDTNTIHYRLLKAGNVTINIYDSQNGLVKTLKDNVPEQPGLLTAVWDGKDKDGNVVSDAIYTYKIDAIDSGGKSAPQVVGTITVDNNYVAVIAPQNNSTITGTITLKAVASQYTRNELVSFSYRKKGSQEWYFLGHCEKQPDGSWQISWDTRVLDNADYEAVETIYYYDLNNELRLENSIPFTYAVDNRIAAPDITDLAVILNPFSPDETGTWVDPTTGEVYQDPAPGLILDDVTHISFQSSSYGFFTIDIFDYNNQLVRNLTAQTCYPDPTTNKLEFIWNGKDNQGFFVKNGRYNIKVDPGNPDKAQTISVDVNKKPFITQAIAEPSVFSPNGDGIYDTTNVYYYISENSYVTVGVYDNQNNLVRTLVSNKPLDSGRYIDPWDGTDDNGTLLTGTRYTIKISAQAQTGAVGDDILVPVAMSYLSGVSISTGVINPSKPEAVTINYWLSQEGIITLKIHNSENAVVRTLVDNTPRSSGQHAEVWDGKGDNENIVPDGRYYFTIEDSIRGASEIIYNPCGTGGQSISASISLDVTDFNPRQNEFCALTYNIPQPAEIKMKVRYERFFGPAIKVLRYYEPVAPGQYTIYWDGRDEAGNFAVPKTYLFVIWGYTLDENSIIVIGGRPEITAYSVTPINFNPYVTPYTALPSQDDKAEIMFTVSMDSYVSVQVYSASGALVKTLLNDSFANKGAVRVVWDGKDDSGKIAAHGDYRIIIQARKDNNYSEPISLHAHVRD